VKGLWLILTFSLSSYLALIIICHTTWLLWAAVKNVSRSLMINLCDIKQNIWHMQNVSCCNFIFSMMTFIYLMSLFSSFKGYSMSWKSYLILYLLVNWLRCLGFWIWLLLKIWLSIACRLCVCVCVCVCTYIYIYIYTHTRVYVKRWCYYAKYWILNTSCLISLAQKFSKNRVVILHSL
jgi:hypothetical protein